jgi:hypothetical protein
MTKLCDINPAAKDKLPPTFAEKSGIGSHYVDAFVKPVNTKLVFLTPGQGSSGLTLTPPRPHNSVT